MYCRNCGSALNQGAKFCGKCGNSTSEINTVAKAKSMDSFSLQNEPTPVMTEVVAEKETPKLKGLGGWLVLVIISLFISLGFQLYTVYTDVNLYKDGTVDLVTDPSFENYIPGYSGFIKFELIASILLSLTAVYLIYLFFKTKKEFPKYYIVFLVAALIYVIIEYMVLQSYSDHIKSLISDTIDEQNTTIGRTVVGAIIWISYMIKSKRVKATFIN